MSTFAPVALALAMISAALLLIGGIRLYSLDRKRALLMIAAALVLIGNVLIWTL